MADDDKTGAGSTGGPGGTGGTHGPGGSRALLGDAEITEGLAGLDQWEREGDALVRTVEAPSFVTAIDLVSAIGRRAEEADHHPDIDIRWRTLRFALSTHSEGGITAKDLAMARQIEVEVGRYSGSSEGAGSNEGSSGLG